MKLNIDCVRDILISAEEVITFEKSFYYEKDAPSSLSDKYSHDEIIYHILQARDSGLITTSSFYDSGRSVYITDLTPKGHEFLANIRTETVWNKLKSKGGCITSYSFLNWLKIWLSHISKVYYDL